MISSFGDSFSTGSFKYFEYSYFSNCHKILEIFYIPTNNQCKFWSCVCSTECGAKFFFLEHTHYISIPNFHLPSLIDTHSRTFIMGQDISTYIIPPFQSLQNCLMKGQIDIIGYMVYHRQIYSIKANNSRNSLVLHHKGKFVEFIPSPR